LFFKGKTRGTVAGGPRWTTGGGGHGTHQSSALCPFLGTKTHRGGIKSEWERWWSSPGSPTAGAAAVNKNGGNFLSQTSGLEHRKAKRMR
jgi:hypothetical protein